MHTCHGRGFDAAGVDACVYPIAGDIEIVYAGTVGIDTEFAAAFNRHDILLGGIDIDAPILAIESGLPLHGFASFIS